METARQHYTFDSTIGDTALVMSGAGAGVDSTGLPPMTPPQQEPTPLQGTNTNPSTPNDSQAQANGPIATAINNNNNLTLKSPMDQSMVKREQMTTPGSNVSQPQQKQCAGCSGKIQDRFLLQALDRYWHHQCLRCSCCHANLADIGQSCFHKNGMILCKADYSRMFPVATGACTWCGQAITANELVQKVYLGSAPPNQHPPFQVYHLHCFQCVSCHSQLQPGDRYNMVNGSLLCEHDCAKLLKNQQQANAAAAASQGIGNVRQGGSVKNPRKKSVC